MKPGVSKPKVVLLGARAEAGAALTPSTPLASLPPAFSHHTYLSCPIRLGFLPTEPDKEATGQGRDRQGRRQRWQKEGGEEAPGLSGVASEEKGNLVPGFVLCAEHPGGRKSCCTQEVQRP